MQLDWQSLAVVVLVVASIGYLARVAWRSVNRRQAAACGGCAQCPVDDESTPVVELESLTKAGSALHETQPGEPASPQHR